MQLLFVSCLFDSSALPYFDYALFILIMHCFILIVHCFILVMHCFILIMHCFTL